MKMLPENYFKTANKLKDSGQLYTAMVAYQKVLTIKPDYVEAYKKLAEVYLLQGNFDAAIACCKEVLKVQPQLTSVYLILGNIFQEKNQFEQAINAYFQALKLQPNLAEVYVYLGSIYNRRGQLDLAIFNYERALEINPNIPSVRLILGNIFIERREFERAIFCYQIFQQLEPENPQVYFKLGGVFTLQNDFEAALDYYQKSLSIKPNYQEAFAELYRLLKPEITEQELGILFTEWQDFALANNHNIERYIDSVIEVEEGRSGATPHRRQMQGVISGDDNSRKGMLTKGGNGHQERKKEKGRRKKWMGTQTSTNCKYPVDGGVLNPKEKDKSIEQKFEAFENNTDNFPGLNQVKKNQDKFIQGKTFKHQELETEKYLDSVIQHQSSQYLEQEKFTVYPNREIIESDEDHEIQATTLNLIPEQKFEAFENNTDNFPGLNQVKKNQEKLSQSQTFKDQESETEFVKKLLKYPAAETYRNQADIALGQGDLTVAIAHCKEALKIQPDYAPCYVTLGNAFYRQNNLAAALSAYNLALEIEPEVAEVYGNVGSVYLQLGQHKQALFYYQKAVYLKPDLPGIYWNIGKLFQYLGKVDEALESWEKALEIQPDIVEADFHFKLGNTLVKLSRINDAVRSYQRAINLKPDYTEAYSNLANILGKQGDREAAAKYYQKALNINPELKHLNEKLANNFLLKGDYDRAIYHYQIAIKYNPNSYDAYANLGTALSNKGLLKSALEKYHQALELKPNWAEVYSRIGHIIKQEKMEEAIALFEKAIELKPQFVEAHQQLCDLLSHTTKLAQARKAADNFCNSCGEIAPILSGTAFLFAYFQSGVSDMANSKLSQVEKFSYQNCETFSEVEIKLLYEIFLFAVPHLRDNLEGNAKFYKLIAKQYYQNIIKNYPTPKTHISNSQPLKIGFLSKHFRRHSVGWCSEALIRELSQITPHVHLYITGSLKRDDITQKFEQMSVKTYWPKKYPNGFPSYEEIVEQTLEDKLDVIVDLDSMTLPVNVHIIHEQPAQVCVSWLGFDAPYISESNYFLCDWYTHPQGREKHYLEKLVRLPETSVAVDGFDSHSVDRNATRNTLGIDSDKMVYLCIAPGRKTNPEMVRAQLKILQHTPESILIRKGQGDVDVIYQTYLQESENLGVDFNRIIFLGQTQTEEEHRAIYQIADVLLDSYPYNGGTHNLEALWANLPIITRAGEQYLSRMGYSFLQNVNLDIGVAWSWEEYTEWGIKLGKDLGLRNSVREHLQRSKNPDNLAPLWNPKKLAKQMYQIFVELRNK
ncbi:MULTISPECIES: tetratricopeptide repeat protein [unclassified Okeania]|uniref:tetratricopeptide repeat protein n=1 Tax=unclassified Okeania TaxID=2634635 RepID=UPI00257A99F1|nr:MULTISPECIES: tetratricopeptide repeat protein [unclassified Okeania]